MTLTISIPDELEAALRAQLGTSLEQSAREDLAAAWFTAGKLSSRQVAQLLGVSVFEAHAFLKKRRAPMPMTADEVAADATALSSLQQP